MYPSTDKKSFPIFTIRVLTSTLLLLGLVSIVLAAPGDLDTTFGSDNPFGPDQTGIQFTDIGVNSPDKAYAMASQTTGEIILAGSSGNDLAVTRYTSLGQLDNSFSGDGKVTTTILLGPVSVFAVAVQDDGMIVVAGSVNNGTKDNILIARYTGAGILDTGFNNPLGYLITPISAGMDVGQAIAIQDDQKILVAGYADTQFVLLRYTTAGVLDSTFSGDGIATASIGPNDLGHAIAIQPLDGKILVAGETDNQADNDFALARFTTSGTLDISFNFDGWATTDFGGNNDFAYSIALQPDGKIILAGTSGNPEDFAIARYTPDGSPDTTFSIDGKATLPIGADSDQAYTLALQPTGKIVVAGFSFDTTNNNDFALARFLQNGTLDSSFGIGGFVTKDLGPILSGIAADHTDDQAYAIVIQPDNKIVLGGYNDYPPDLGDNNFILARYLSPNNAPTISTFGKSAFEDNVIQFTMVDFDGHFNDIDGDSLFKIQITSLPANGTLELNSVAVTLNQEITASDLSALTLTPDTDFVGNTSFGWNGSDGLDYAALSAQVDLTFAAVNDAPSFTPGADPSVNEDSGLQISLGWATAISAGPVDESAQIVSFLIGTDNDALFSVTPAINSSTGNLTFTPATNEFGTAQVNVTLLDNGGTANGGQNMSAAQVFTITTNAVNDVPSFVIGTDQIVDEDSGAHSIPGWATSLSAGPSNESSQTLSFPVSTDNDALFSSLPAVSATGELSFNPAPNMNGSATVSVSIQDSGGTLNGGVDTSTAQTFLITVNPVNDAPQVSTYAKTGLRNRPLIFSIADYSGHFSDVDGDSLAKIQIKSLPVHGQLLLSGVPVSIDQEILTNNLGNLTFQPDAFWIGASAFEWNASDGTIYGAANASVNIAIETGHLVLLPVIRK